MRDRFRLQPVVETQSLNLAKQFDPGSSVLGYVEKACSAFFVVLLGLLLLPTAALAVAYDFSGSVGDATYPPCDGWGGGAVSGTTTFTCTKTISLATGDSIASSRSITVGGDQGIALAGGNTIGSASKTVDLEITSGSLRTRGNRGQTPFFPKG